VSLVPEVVGKSAAVEGGSNPPSSEEARQRLRQRVDEMLGECNRLAQRNAPPAPPAAQTPDSTAAPVPERTQPARPAHRALVLEGNPLHRKVLIRALENAGYEVDALDNPAEAIEAFQRCPYGIVLLDCDTPEMDGYRTAASLRMMEGEARHTPIIGLTGNSGQAHRRERKAAGIDNYLLKPFRRDLVESVVSRYAPSASVAAGVRLVALDKDRIRELQELASGDAQLLQELIDIFLTSAPELMQQMRRAVEDEDAAALHKAAHTLKGSSGQMGALRMQELCGTLETLAATGSLVGVEAPLSEVSVSFERAVSELKALAKPPAPAKPAGAVESSQRPANAAKANEILLAEDDPLIARFLSSSLTAAGFHVTHVTDGNAALDTLRGKNFGVVVLDINMPGIDGYQVLTEIRATVGDHTPVAIISSRHQEQDVLRAFDLGVDDYLTKPFNPSEVVARVKRLARQAARS
jgi:DNA-binding response OmpR family regulator